MHCTPRIIAIRCWGKSCLLHRQLEKVRLCVRCCQIVCEDWPIVRCLVVGVRGRTVSIIPLRSGYRDKVMGQHPRDKSIFFVCESIQVHLGHAGARLILPIQFGVHSGFYHEPIAVQGTPRPLRVAFANSLCALSSAYF
jgi:hypothetical protein